MSNSQTRIRQLKKQRQKTSDTIFRMGELFCAGGTGRMRTGGNKTRPKLQQKWSLIPCIFGEEKSITPILTEQQKLKWHAQQRSSLCSLESSKKIERYETLAWRLPADHPQKTNHWNNQKRWSTISPKSTLKMAVKLRPNRRFCNFYWINEDRRI